MKTIPLTKGLFTVVDDEDYHLVSGYKWHLTSAGYAATHPMKRGPTLLMHRMICGLTEKGKCVDHSDRNPLNNTRSNLRVCDWSRNLANRPKQRNNTSGFKGVTWSKQKGKWIARVVKMGRVFHAGFHSTPEAASRRHDEVARIVFGEFAFVNAA